jgi:hypothetical protein
MYGVLTTNFNKISYTTLKSWKYRNYIFLLSFEDQGTNTLKPWKRFVHKPAENIINSSRNFSKIPLKCIGVYEKHSTWTYWNLLLLTCIFIPYTFINP